MKKKENKDTEKPKSKKDIDQLQDDKVKNDDKLKGGGFKLNLPSYP
jgi:hypothetical protein